MKSKISSYLVALSITTLICGGTASATTMDQASNLLLDAKYKDAEDAYKDLLSQDQNGDAYAGLAVALQAIAAE